jgi:ADP-ribosylglycohydrolase
MAGTVSGAYLGEAALPERWLRDLEFAGELREMADGLHALAGAPGSLATQLNGAAAPVPSVISAASRRDRFVGCLLGGAVGDALGAAIEFDSWSQIQDRFGSRGIRGYAPAYGRVGAITDDTQMTLFTAEGLIRAHNRVVDRGLVNVEAVIHRAYERWLMTQVRDRAAVPWDPELGDSSESSWLIRQDFLHHRRAPGNTCLAALSQRYQLAAPDRPINHSKGCGGVMRVAPVGLTMEDAFDLGCRTAALTHGHPNGWLAAGALAEMVARLVQGASRRDAAEIVLERCREHPQGSEVAGTLEQAMTLAEQPGRPTPETVESLGEGWVAEEALAISVYCALTANGFRDGVLNAVNHSGDSDSTGSITGNLLGASLGREAIDDDLLNPLEGRDVIEQVGIDLYDMFAESGEPDWQRYPPW